MRERMESGSFRECGCRLIPISFSLSKSGAKLKFVGHMSSNRIATGMRASLIHSLTRMVLTSSGPSAERLRWFSFSVEVVGEIKLE